MEVLLHGIEPQRFEELPGREAARLPDTVVLLAGEGPERPRLEAEARALGVDLRLPGWLEDVRPALAAMDVFALASDSELIRRADDGPPGKDP